MALSWRNCRPLVGRYSESWFSWISFVKVIFLRIGIAKTIHPPFFTTKNGRRFVGNIYSQSRVHLPTCGSHGVSPTCWTFPARGYDFQRSPHHEGDQEASGATFVCNFFFWGGGTQGSERTKGEILLLLLLLEKDIQDVGHSIFFGVFFSRKIRLNKLRFMKSLLNS